jgi:hypothetical protein
MLICDDNLIYLRPIMLVETWRRCKHCFKWLLFTVQNIQILVHVCVINGLTWAKQFVFLRGKI